jgi:hypothetical protein
MQVFANLRHDFRQRRGQTIQLSVLSRPLRSIARYDVLTLCCHCLEMQGGLLSQFKFGNEQRLSEIVHPFSYFFWRNAFMAQEGV